MKSRLLAFCRLIVLFSFCWIEFAFPQTDFWEPTEVPVDAIHEPVQALGINANGDIYAASNGIYRSIDEGDSWTYLSGRDSLRVAFFATNSQGHNFIGARNICDFQTGQCARGGVYRSIDGGATWQRVGLANIDVYGLIIDSNDDIYVAGGGIYKSEDNGNTWTPINTGLVNLAVVSLAMNSSGHLFAAAGGIFRSTNSGDLWVPVNVGLESHGMNHIAISPNDNLFAQAGNDIYRSTDNGDTWIPLHTTFAYNLTFVAVTSNGYLFAHSIDLGLYRSTDNGNSWKSVDNEIGYRIHYVFASDTNGRVFVGTDEGVFRSSDYGDHWSFSSRNVLSYSRGTHLLSNAEGVIFAASESQGLFRSLDKGRNWTPINTGLPSINTGFIVYQAGTLFLTSASDGDLFVGTHGEPLFGMTDSIFVSHDHGDHWTSIKTGLTDMEIPAFAINMDGHLFIGTLGAGVLRSTDNGDTWSSINAGLTDRYVSVLGINPSGHLFAGTYGGIFRSTNNGENWTPINNGFTGPLILSFAFGANGLAFVGGEPAYRSINNGDQWTTITEFTGAHQFLVHSSGYIFARTGGGVYRSTDNGDNWVPLPNSGLGDASIYSLAIDPDGYIYAGTQRGVYRSIETTTSVKEIPGELPETFSLEQNYPNPFNPTTTIRFALSHPNFVSLKVYNTLGQEIASLVSKNLAAGRYEVNWNASGLASGVYLHRLQAGEFVETKKLTVLR